jgi:hypothetical protein
MSIGGIKEASTVSQGHAACGSANTFGSHSAATELRRLLVVGQAIPRINCIVNTPCPKPQRGISLASE